MLTPRQIREIDRLREKPVAKKYTLVYSSRRCHVCKLRKPTAGCRNILQGNGTKVFVCADCKGKI